MTAQTQTLPTLEKGAEYNITIVCTGKDGTPTNFDNCTALMHVRPYLESNEILIELSTDNGRLTLTAGLIAISLTGADTNAMTGTSSVYDILVTFSPGHPKRILGGSWPLSNGVTRT